jgi:hypothetical protein
LTASDVLQSDISPKVDILKDILFVMKLYPSYVDSKDYISIRSSLRSEPVVNLRKTCLKLQKYLPLESQKQFKIAYGEMIDSLTDMDLVIIIIFSIVIIVIITLTITTKDNIYYYKNKPL